MSKLLVFSQQLDQSIRITGGWKYVSCFAKIKGNNSGHTGQFQNTISIKTHVRLRPKEFTAYSSVTFHGGKWQSDIINNHKNHNSQSQRFCCSLTHKQKQDFTNADCRLQYYADLMLQESIFKIKLHLMTISRLRPPHY